jgi:outer membrane immunogenic protein
MKSLLLSGVALIALAAGPAMAADLARPLYKAPPPAPPPLPTWTGFYVGGHLGGAWETRGIAEVSDPLMTISFEEPVSSDINTSAFLGGGQIGYNYQFSPNWLVGIEGDISGTHLRAGANSNDFPTLDNTVVQFGSNVDWVASARTRLGYVWDNSWLLYVTGGAAWADFKFNGNFLCPGLTCIGSDGLVALGSGSSTDVTWVAGAGVQWRPAGQNWSLGVEYLYYGFDTTHNFPGTEFDATTGQEVSFGDCLSAPHPTPCNLQFSIKDSNIQVARVRFDWYFTP